jgi:hypothetical protein
VGDDSERGSGARQRWAAGEAEAPARGSGTAAPARGRAACTAPGQGEATRGGSGMGQVTESVGPADQTGDCSILDDVVPDRGPCCRSFFHPCTAKVASRTGYRTPLRTVSVDEQT